ncbi:SMI1/KNR4 family protein [Streptomyces bambusae]|uniref:SMI1/KNR4 family protein n=1 Tax=Streptomyces bambusae TaxID=1550616 RepID=A0ABS6YZW6_9ACTN|nr:SMI1/KNR4 family protein [Streptomyces bambusae]MBW5481030.1 SMI1/KNR4 family protein [Streptomyces bambusae]
MHDFATWEPLLRLLRAGNTESLTGPGGHVAGRIGRGSCSLPLRGRLPLPGRRAVQRVQDALVSHGADEVSFTAQIAPDGRTALHVIGSSPAVEPGIGNPYPGSLTLVEGAVAEPWRRLPDPTPGALPAPSADPALLERTLRERLPDAVGATEAEIAAAEARLGVALPGELKALYRVTRSRWDHRGDDTYDAVQRESAAVGCELISLDGLYVADAASRPASWRFAAMYAVTTPPDAAVQGLVGSPGWIVFGDNGGGDRLAVDLTPGPGGHTGQIIVIDHEHFIGAALLADSLTDLVVGGRGEWRSDRVGEQPPAVAHVGIRSPNSIEDAVHPDLEVLSVGGWEAEPVSLAPVLGLPRLRTVTAYPGTLADPREISRLKGLEYLALGPEDWRVLLDADAVPRTLSAAAVTVHGRRPDPLPVVALANELLTLWDRPPITVTVVEGDLGPPTG